MELLSNYTTLNIGGPALAINTAHNESELIDHIILATTKNQKYLVIGSGSNLLVSDDGYPGIIIKNEIQGIRQEGNILKVKSGTILQELVDFANQHSLSGVQALAGIPGTVGGAVFGNAGAYGQTISDHLIKVVALNPKHLESRIFHPSKEVSSAEFGLELLHELNKDQCHFGYRDSEFKRNKYILVEIIFELSEGNAQALKTESEETIKKREVKYPPGIKCPGSFFKNIIANSLPHEVLTKIPPDKIMYGKIPAGALLEMVGAKGDNQGDIEIANYHANLFVNKGNGNAKDFYELAQKYYQKVKDQFGITLEPEVQLINLPSLNHGLLN
jgi:UDP-N-acetylmuramate dehydrogenase